MAKKPNFPTETLESKSARRYFLVPTPENSSIRDKYKQLIIKAIANEVDENTEKRFQNCFISDCESKSSVATQWYPVMLVTHDNKRIQIPDFKANPSLLHDLSEDKDEQKILDEIKKNKELRFFIKNHRISIAFCIKHFIEQIVQNNEEVPEGLTNEESEE